LAVIPVRAQRKLRASPESITPGVNRIDCIATTRMLRSMDSGPSLQSAAPAEANPGMTNNWILRLA
jgi:hypothetical protein